MVPRKEKTYKEGVARKRVTKEHPKAHRIFKKKLLLKMDQAPEEARYPTHRRERRREQGEAQATQVDVAGEEQGTARSSGGEEEGGHTSPRERTKLQTSKGEMSQMTHITVTRTAGETILTQKCALIGRKWDRSPVKIKMLTLI